ncbi:MAG: hypothetical protein GVY24_05385 [Planctomycetes bacterium]|jgi:hypothetical protein|nr:hypothetical protein [Planctomycetota bacterium]
MRVEFLEAAEAELVESAAYYEAQAGGLGERFLFEARITIDWILELPGRGRELQPGIRKLKLPHFLPLRHHLRTPQRFNLHPRRREPDARTRLLA